MVPVLALVPERVKALKLDAILLSATLPNVIPQTAVKAKEKVRARAREEAKAVKKVKVKVRVRVRVRVREAKAGANSPNNIHNNLC